MGTPVLTSCIDNVQAALLTITEANGYWDTVAAAYKMGGTAPDIRNASLPVALIHVSNPELVRRGAAGGVELIDRKVGVAVGMVTQKPLEEAGDADWEQEEAMRMEAAITKAIIADRQRGGFAIDTKYRVTNFFPEDLSEFPVSVAVIFELEYRTREGDFEEMSA